MKERLQVTLDPEIVAFLRTTENGSAYLAAAVRFAVQAGHRDVESLNAAVFAGLGPKATAPASKAQAPRPGSGPGRGMTIQLVEGVPLPYVDLEELAQKYEIRWVPHPSKRPMERPEG